MKRFIKLDPGVTFADADAFAEQNLKLPLVEPAEAQPEGQEDGSGASLSEAPARRLRSRSLQLTQSLTSGTGCSFAPGTQCFERLKSEGLWGLGRVGGCAKGGGSSCDGGHEVRYKMGYGVHVYVLDTGIMTTHDEFRFLNRSGEDGGEVRAIPTFEVSDDGLRECDSKDTSCALDRHGHGTHAAGIIGGNLYGLAKYATLHACKVLDDDGSSSMWRFMVGVNWVAEKGKRPAIIAASVSASGRSASLEREISRAVNGGVVVVVAAGNVGDTSAGNVDSDSCSVFPGNIPFVVTVGATNADDTKASFSRGGSCIDMFAPGQDILSAGISKRNATRMMSSTSMAASHVAGVATLLQWDSDESHLMPEQIKKRLVESAADGQLKQVGKDTPNKLVQYAPLAATGPVEPAEVSTTTPRPTTSQSTIVTLPPQQMSRHDDKPFNCLSGANMGEKYAEDWSEEKRKFCCTWEEMGCSSEPFDCSADFGNWEGGWSEKKKEWCCKVSKRGC